MRGKISLVPLSASSAAACLGKCGKPFGVLVVVEGFLLLFYLGNVVCHELECCMYAELEV